MRKGKIVDAEDSKSSVGSGFGLSFATLHALIRRAVLCGDTALECRDACDIFLTHDLEEAAYLSDRILVMGTNPGRVIEFIENPIPRPRSPAQFASPEYLALKVRLEDLIHPPVEGEADKLPVVKMTWSEHHAVPQ